MCQKNNMGEFYGQVWVRSVQTMTEVLLGKKTSIGGGEEKCVTKCKRQKEQEEQKRGEKNVIELPLRSWETSEKTKSPLGFRCTDLNSHPQASIIQAKELVKELFKCFAKLRKLIVVFLIGEDWAAQHQRMASLFNEAASHSSTWLPNLRKYNKCTSRLLCGTPI